MYVCGITPYDATHLGHAATHATFDLVNRVMRDVWPHRVLTCRTSLMSTTRSSSAPTVTESTSANLAAGEAAPFRRRHDRARRAATRCLHSASRSRWPTSWRGSRHCWPAARIPTVRARRPGHDVYLDPAQVADFGRVSGWSRDDMLAVCADRGATRTVWASGCLDPFSGVARPCELTWEAPRSVPVARVAHRVHRHRPGTPGRALRPQRRRFGSGLPASRDERGAIGGTRWRRHLRGTTTPPGDGRPGWREDEQIQGQPRLRLDVALRRVDPMVIRLVLLDHHHATDWEFTDEQLTVAQERLDTWRQSPVRKLCPRGRAPARRTQGTARG